MADPLKQQDKLKYGLVSGYWSFSFGDKNEYELCFEPLLWDNQMYVALYKDKKLLTEKVVVKPGFVKEDEEVE